jgi:plastocyanin
LYHLCLTSCVCIYLTDSLIPKRGTRSAIALSSSSPSASSSYQIIATKKTNPTIEKVSKPAHKQTLTLSNIITKMTTTQGNVSTNANTASTTFSSKEANATKAFPTTNKVTIVVGAALKRDKSYQPNPVNVKAGGTVTWTNNDSVIYTVTSGFGSNDLNYGKQFDSGLLVKGQ